MGKSGLAKDWFMEGLRKKNQDEGKLIHYGMGIPKDTVECLVKLKVAHGCGGV